MAQITEYQEDLIEVLKNQAAAYLNAAIEREAGKSSFWLYATWPRLMADQNRVQHEKIRGVSLISPLFPKNWTAS